MRETANIINLTAACVAGAILLLGLINDGGAPIILGSILGTALCLGSFVLVRTPKSRTNLWLGYSAAALFSLLYGSYATYETVRLLNVGSLQGAAVIVTLPLAAIGLTQTFVNILALRGAIKTPR